MKMKGILKLLTCVIALVAFASCEIVIDPMPVSGYDYWGINNSQGAIPAEITFINQLTNVDLFSAYLTSGGLDISGDLFGPYIIDGNTTRTVYGVPYNTNTTLEISFSNSVIGDALFTGLNTQANDYDIYVRIDTGATSPIVPRSVGPNTTEYAGCGISVLIQAKPR